MSDTQLEAVTGADGLSLIFENLALTIDSIVLSDHDGRVADYPVVAATAAERTNVNALPAYANEPASAPGHIAFSDWAITFDPFVLMSLDVKRYTPTSLTYLQLAFEEFVLTEFSIDKVSVEASELPGTDGLVLGGLSIQGEFRVEGNLNLWPH